MGNRVIDIYPKPNSEESSCGCMCSCSSISLEDMTSEFQKRYSNEFEINMATYSTEESKTNAINILNGLFKDTELVIGNDNFDLVLSQAAPIIVSEDKIISAGFIPSTEAVYKAVTSGAAIQPKSGCC